MFFGSVLPMYLLHCVVLFSRNLLEERLLVRFFFLSSSQVGPPSLFSLLSPHFFFLFLAPLRSSLLVRLSVCLFTGVWVYPRSL